MPTEKLTQHQTVTITFNGEDHAVTLQPHASTQALLEHAKQAFNVQSNHLLSLFTQDGLEITNDQQSAAEAGIEPGTLLILRQSTVRGGQ